MKRLRTLPRQASTAVCPRLRRGCCLSLRIILKDYTNLVRSKGLIVIFTLKSTARRLRTLPLHPTNYRWNWAPVTEDPMDIIKDPWVCRPPPQSTHLILLLYSDLVSYPTLLPSRIGIWTTWIQLPHNQMHFPRVAQLVRQSLLLPMVIIQNHLNLKLMVTSACLHFPRPTHWRDKSWFNPQLEQVISRSWMKTMIVEIRADKENQKKTRTLSINW